MATAQHKSPTHAQEPAITSPGPIVPRIRTLSQLHPRTRTIQLTPLRNALAQVGPREGFEAAVDILLRSPAFAPLANHIQAILVETMALDDPADTRIVWSRSTSAEFIGRMLSWAEVDPVRLAQLDLAGEVGTVFDLWDTIALEDLPFPLKHRVFRGLYDSEDDSWVSVTLKKDHQHIWLLSFWYRRKGELAQERARRHEAGDTRLLVRSLLTLVSDELVGAFHTSGLATSPTTRRILAEKRGTGTLILTNDGTLVSASPGVMKAIAAYTGLSPRAPSNKRLLPEVIQSLSRRAGPRSSRNPSHLESLLSTIRDDRLEDNRLVLRFPEVANVRLLDRDDHSPANHLTESRLWRTLRSRGTTFFSPPRGTDKGDHYTGENEPSNQPPLKPEQHHLSPGRSIDSPEVQELLEQRRRLVDELLELDERILDAINFGEPVDSVLFQRGRPALELLKDGRSRAVTIERKQKGCTLHPPSHPAYLEVQSTEPSSTMQTAGGALIGRAYEGEVLLLQRRQRGRGRGATDVAVLTPPSEEGLLSVHLSAIRRLLRGPVSDQG